MGSLSPRTYLNTADHTIAANMTKEEMEKVALENDKVQASIGDKTVVKVIAIPKKLINIVVK